MINIFIVFNIFDWQNTKWWKILRKWPSYQVKKRRLSPILPRRRLLLTSILQSRGLPKIWSKQRKKILIVQGCSTKCCSCLDCHLVEFNYDSYSLPFSPKKEAVFCCCLMNGSISGWIWVSKHADGVVKGSWHNLGTLAAFLLHLFQTQPLISSDIIPELKDQSRSFIINRQTKYINIYVCIHI